MIFFCVMPRRPPWSPRTDTLLPHTTLCRSCVRDEQFHGAPCGNLDKRVEEEDTIGRFNLSWKLDEDRMVYATWSEGYRPGGINRRGTVPPYKIGRAHV